MGLYAVRGLRKDLIHAPPQKAGLRVCETASQRGRVVLVEDCGACIRRCTLAVRDIAGVEVSMLFRGRGDIHKHCDVREAQITPWGHAHAVRGGFVTPGVA